MFGRKKHSSSVAASPRSAPQTQNGTTTGGSASTSMPSPVLIQKFIVLHEGLMPLPDHAKSAAQQNQRRLRRNPTSMLSEDALLDEHGEFILYYYDHALNAPHNGGRRSPPSAADNNDTDKEMRGSLVSAMSDGFSSIGEEQTAVRISYASEDAVRFAGVCRALRSLPMALRPQKYEDDDVIDDDNRAVAETEVVHLSDSTLVFVPLELDGDIVAIAQLPRAINRCNPQRQPSNHSTNSGGDTVQSNLGYGADPSAIQEAIRQIHSLFLLMHGGGIHRTLLRTRHLEQSKEWAMEVDDEKLNGSANNDDSRKSIDNDQPRRCRSKARVSRKLSNSLSITDSDNNDYYQDTNGAIRKGFNRHDKHLQDYRYGGMKELFDLRREYREIQSKHREEEISSRFGGIRKTSRWGSSSNAEDLFAGIANELGHNDCLNRIDKLLEVLPITTLRKDLECFYDEWLWRMQGVCDIMKGGAGRCVVEMIPAPLFSLQSSTMRDIPVRGQHPPQAPQPFVCLAGAEFIKSLTSDELPQLNGESGLQFSRLLGVSLFYQNRFVLSKMKNEIKILFPPEIPCMIAEYLRSYSQREEERNFIAEITKGASEPRDNNASRPNHNALERWMSNRSLNQDDKCNLSPPRPTPMEVLSGFAQPPAQFGTHENEQSPSFFVPDLKQNVWLPNLHLPCPSIASMIEHDDAIESHVAMFGKGDFTFLLYFELQDPYGGGSILEQMAEEMNARDVRLEGGKLISGEVIEEEAEAFSSLLTFLDSQISKFCDTYSERDSSDSVSTAMSPVKEINSHRLFQGEAGMDIIHINRNENSFILLSQHDLSSNEFKRVANEPVSNETKPKGLFGLGQKAKQEEQESTMKHRPTHHGDILDCRHKLAAYLPLDVMLAFDDMFNEVGRLSQRRNVLRLTMNDEVPQSNSTEDSDSIKAIELCTFLPQGWVYCHANGDQELYILLDTSKFVTIADVQKAVVRVRERITSLP
ncbi:hypothetical protein QTG54_013308 [Skeletonema marinoi]|uniref:Uncharacterized protein n=1 Tax=Skeletonema marinoi TaxID=267567 RepID=A0AAD8XYP6_9STRA|nr:hypothetical protein QTG54_013308 [Skeletonema marinoi]